jgi:flagellar protein FlaJ
VKERSVRIGFWGTSFILMQPFVRSFEKYFRDMTVDLSKGGLRITYRAYVAGMMLASTVGLVAGGVGGYLTAYALNTYWVFKLLMPLGFALLGGASTFSVFYFFPRLRAASRGRKLDSELSHAVGHMAGLASAGFTPEKMFHSLAEEESKDVVNQEAKMIVRDMSLLGMDLQDAVKAEQKRSPSEKFVEFLDGFASASKTGGDLKTYLLRAASSMMLDKRLKARAIADSVGLVAEMYTIVLVVTPLLLLIMFAVIGVVVGSIGGLSILTLMYFTTYALVPLGGIMVLVIADSTVSQEVP